MMILTFLWHFTVRNKLGPCTYFQTSVLLQTKALEAAVRVIGLKLHICVKWVPEGEMLLSQGAL